MKIAATGSVPKNLPPHNFGKPRNVSRLVLGGESKPQPRRAGRHFREACKLGCEGIVSKRLGSMYRRGRSPHWIKFKNPKAPAIRREAEEDWAR